MTHKVAFAHVKADCANHPAIFHHYASGHYSISHSNFVTFYLAGKDLFEVFAFWHGEHIFTNSVNLLEVVVAFVIFFEILRPSFRVLE